MEMQHPCNATSTTGCTTLEVNTVEMDEAGGAGTELRKEKTKEKIISFCELFATPHFIHQYHALSLYKAGEANQSQNALHRKRNF